MQKKPRWWERLHWRFALVTVFVSLFAMSAMAVSALVALTHFYVSEQNHRVEDLTESRVQEISLIYRHMNGNKKTEWRKAMLCRAVMQVLTNVSRKSLLGEQSYVMAVISPANTLVYPTPDLECDEQHGGKSWKAPFSPTVAQFLDKLIAASGREKEKMDFTLLRGAIQQAQMGEEVAGTFGPSWLPQPFMAQPIRLTRSDGTSEVLGVLFVTTRFAIDESMPQLIVNVGSVVLTASLIIAVIAAVIAILFTRTITRPLAKLSKAARQMAGGEYHAQVVTRAGGELGELAHAFNEMSAQLRRDVEELRRQEVLRRELIMNITHDLATPLTAITGLGEALIDGVNQSREDYEATGQIIVRETLRLRRLVQDIHMIAKVEEGALHPRYVPVRLAALVDEVFAVLTPEFERTNLEPINAVPYHLAPVQADRDMLFRVFSNLCENALSHTPSGGTVTVSAEREGNYLRLSVTDTGQGIPEEALTRVFERFYRADSARSSQAGKKAGSGLGLAIVKAIIEAHGGSVSAENRPQGGARISFTLPLRDSKGKQQEKAEERLRHAEI
uniref:histidine kinase n=1 Tax=Thermosporothrix sp. COM3 TaxID=2490863 RepID=A0A455SQV4_9CHLR|nr:hypothetical protein KTC_40530 [Thermosporothrix sp. COM3]